MGLDLLGSVGGYSDLLDLRLGFHCCHQGAKRRVFAVVAFLGAAALVQTDLFTGVDGCRRVVEQNLGATPQAEILEDDHAEDAAAGHAPPKSKSRALPCRLFRVGLR